MVTACTPWSRAFSHSGPWRQRRAEHHEHRRPEKTPPHRFISRHLETWLATRSLRDRPVATHVEAELRGYLRCGILCFGFARGARWRRTEARARPLLTPPPQARPVGRPRPLAQGHRPGRARRRRSLAGGVPRPACRPRPATAEAPPSASRRPRPEPSAQTPPSRPLPPGASAHAARPRRAGTPRGAAATRLKSPASTTPPGSRGRGSSHGSQRSFHSSALGCGGDIRLIAFITDPAPCRDSSKARQPVRCVRKCH